MLLICFEKSSKSLLLRHCEICVASFVRTERHPRSTFWQYNVVIHLFHSIRQSERALLLPTLHFRRSKSLHSTLKARNMSDDTYSNFLDQANQDTGASKASTQSKSASTKAVNTEVPGSLKSVEQYYISEADEPFEPVSLKWGRKDMPAEST